VCTRACSRVILLPALVLDFQGLSPEHNIRFCSYSQIYESILVDGEREKNEHNPIVDALALLKVGGKHLDSADAHVSPRTTQFAYPARSPTLPSVVTWLLPTVVEVVATNEVGGDGDIDDAVEGVTARDQGKRVRNLCKVVRGKLLRLLVSAGWALTKHDIVCVCVCVCANTRVRLGTRICVRVFVDMCIRVSRTLGEYTTAAGVCQSIVEEEEARFESLRKVLLPNPPSTFPFAPFMFLRQFSGP